MQLRTRGVVLGAVAASAVLACVAVTVLLTPRSIELQDAPSEQTVWEAQQRVYSRDHPVYTRCAKRVDMPEFVKAITSKCGDIHELTTIASPCEHMLRVKAADFGCCWETVMAGYEELDPNAAHKWRLWQGTLSGKSGVTFDGEACGDPYGEKGYHDLSQVVAEQQSEIEYLEDGLYEVYNLFWTPPYAGQGGYGYPAGGYSDPYYYKGQPGPAAALAAASTTAPAAAPAAARGARRGPAASAPGAWQDLRPAGAPRVERAMAHAQGAEASAEVRMRTTHAPRTGAKGAERGLAEEAASFLQDVNPRPLKGRLVQAGVNV
jgi:hypothetical protein